MKLLHKLCLTALKLKTRTVVSQPDDKTWPKDFSVVLPFCPNCGLFPSFDEVKKELP